MVSSNGGSIWDALGALPAGNPWAAVDGNRRLCQCAWYDDAPVIGRTQWALAEGYIPDGSHGPEPEMTSHETICFLNAGDEDAHVEITIFFEDRDPVGPYEVTVPAQRTEHVQFNDFEDPEPIPKGTAFASTIESDQPIVCQHTRLDSRQAENALLSTVPYAGE